MQIFSDFMRMMAIYAISLPVLSLVCSVEQLMALCRQCFGCWQSNHLWMPKWCSQQLCEPQRSSRLPFLAQQAQKDCYLETKRYFSKLKVFLCGTWLKIASLVRLDPLLLGYAFMTHAREEMNELIICTWFKPTQIEVSYFPA